jgi:AraC-like DNA-binding protein
MLIERVKREVEALDYHRVDSGRIAHRLRISARTVRRNLASGGTSFHDVVMEQRMTLAKRYLKDPSLPIKQISSSLGYADISSFHRAFRSHTGLTPGQFRGSLGT